MIDQQKREHYRIQYPLKFRPVIKIAVREFIVRDISERGIAFFTGNSTLFKLRERVFAEITFNNGKTLVCRGEVLRKPKDLAVVLLAQPVPLDRIRTEQIHLIKLAKSKK